MEFLLQQEGSLGTIILLVGLLIGLLYLLLPVFIWRIWYWSHQNSKHLQELNTKLELLIRDIAPDALPPIEVPEETTEETATEPVAEETTDGETAGEEDFFPEEEFEGDLSDDDSMDFSMSDEFDDVSDDISDSEISDFTEDESADELADDSSEESEEESDDDDDELVMDFNDDDGDEAESFADETDDIFSETEESDKEDEEAEEKTDDFAFAETASPAPTEIPVTETGPTDFTVEHFESNEEKSFEFEDVDDDSFAGPSDSFSEEDLDTEKAGDDAMQDKTDWQASSTEDIWGDESALGSKTDDDESLKESLSSGDDSDLGSAFDEPTSEEKESTGDIANSFLNDLEDKLNLESFEQQPATPPVSPPAPQPEPTPAPEPPPTESQATLFARCEGCGHKLAYKQALSGKRVRCPACRTAFSLP